MNEDLEKIKSKSRYTVTWIISYIGNNKTTFGMILFFFLVSSLGSLLVKHLNREIELSVTTESTQTGGYVANYKGDMGFLDCLAEQHSCLFKNLKTNNYELIIERCQNEDFCAVKYSSNK